MLPVADTKRLDVVSGECARAGKWQKRRTASLRLRQDSAVGQRGVFAVRTVVRAQAHFLGTFSESTMTAVCTLSDVEGF